MVSSKDMEGSDCSQFLGSKHELAGEAEENHRKSDNNGLRANIWTRDLPETTYVPWARLTAVLRVITSWHRHLGIRATECLRVYKKEQRRGSRVSALAVSFIAQSEEKNTKLTWSPTPSGATELRPSPLILSEAHRCDSPWPQWPAAYHSLMVVLIYCLRPLYLYSQVYILLPPLTQYHTKL